MASSIASSSMQNHEDLNLPGQIPCSWTGQKTVWVRIGGSPRVSEAKFSCLICRAKRTKGTWCLGFYHELRPVTCEGKEKWTHICAHLGSTCPAGLLVWFTTESNLLVKQAAESRLLGAPRSCEGGGCGASASASEKKGRSPPARKRGGGAGGSLLDQQSFRGEGIHRFSARHRSGPRSCLPTTRSFADQHPLSSWRRAALRLCHLALLLCSGPC